MHNHSLSPSFIWNNIILGGKICSKAIAWTPSSRSSINCWHFRWIPSLPPLRHILNGPLNKGEENLVLANLWDGCEWDWSKISFTINNDIIDKASNIRPNPDLGIDKPYWSINSKGIFTTKSVHSINNHIPSNAFSSSWVWKINTFNKIKFFLWLCSYNRLPTKEYLHHIDIAPAPRSSLPNL